MKKPTVLFLCKHNHCRSQMAEAVMRDLAGDRFNVVSAGAFPRPVHPFVFTVLDEAGINSSNLVSKSIDLYLGRGLIEHIIVVCDEVEKYCPKIEPFAITVERWPLPDPAAETGGREFQLQVFRETLEELKSRINAWLSKRPSTERS